MGHSIVEACWWNPNNADDPAYGFDRLPQPDPQLCIVPREELQRGKEVLDQFRAAGITHLDRVELFDTVAVQPVLQPKGYEPMRKVGIHRAFAEIRVDSQRALKFANKFGPLGHGECQLLAPEIAGQLTDIPSLRARRDLAFNTMLIGELLTPWFDMSCRLSDLIGLHDLLRTSAGSIPLAFKNFVRDRSVDCPPQMYDSEQWGPRTPLSPKPWHLGNALLAFDDRVDFKQNSDLAGTLPLAQIAREFLLDQANEHILVTCRPEIGVEEGRMRLHADDLFGAIWAHFALELAGQVVDPKKCPVCGRFWLPRHGREKYCRNACRQRAYRAGESYRKLLDRNAEHDGMASAKRR